MATTGAALKPGPANQALLVLDRDGVLNRLVENPAEPRPDSPMRPDQVALFPWVAAALRDLTAAGFGIVVATNQPAWAKGKATRASLDAVHAAVLAGATALGGVVLSSHVCWHRAEDACLCRKPGTGLLVEAFARHGSDYAPAASWMVGDRAPDILAGEAFGLRTALLGADPAEEAVLAARGVSPTFRGADLRAFADFLLGGANDETGAARE
jgi:histidinol-phosphate phosphatase family protein